MINWIFEFTIGQLIDKITNGLRLDEFMKKIEGILGITKIQETLQKLFESDLEKLCTSLQGIANTGDLKSIPFNLKVVSRSYFLQ